MGWVARRRWSRGTDRARAGVSSAPRARSRGARGPRPGAATIRDELVAELALDQEHVNGELGRDGYRAELVAERGQARLRAAIARSWWAERRRARPRTRSARAGTSTSTRARRARARRRALASALKTR